jgi:AAA+ ATPase superfamily predicted ATPase
MTSTIRTRSSSTSKRLDARIRTRASFCALHDRRRVGKSTLIREAIRALGAKELLTDYMSDRSNMSDDPLSDIVKLANA